MGPRRGGTGSPRGRARTSPRRTGAGGDRGDRAAAVAGARRRPAPRRLHPGPRHLRRLAARPRPTACRSGLTTGATPRPFWEDTRPALARGTRVAYAEEGAAARRPRTAARRASCWPRRAAPLWIDDATLLVSVERAEDDSTRLAVTDTPTAGRAARRQPRATHGDEWGAAVSPGGARGRLRLHAARRPQALRDARRRRWPRARCAPYGTPRDARPRPRLVARRRHAGLRLPSAGRLGRCTSSGADGSGERSSRRTGPTTASALAPRQRRRVGVRAVGASAFGARAVTPAPARWEELAARRAATAARTGPQRRRARRLRGSRDAAALRLVTPGGETPSIHAPAPLRRRSARPQSSPQVSFVSLDGLEIPAPSTGPPTRRAGAVPAIVYPHGGPTTAYREDWTATCGTSSTRAAPGSAGRLPRLDGLRRGLRRAQPRRLGHQDTCDCLAAADQLRRARLGRRRPARDRRRLVRLLMALALVTDDPAHRYPLRGRRSSATATSSRRGRRAIAGRPGPRADDRPAGAGARGVPRQLGRPPPRAASSVPLLIAHGEHDERVESEADPRSSSPSCGGSAGRRSSTSPTRPRRTASCSPGPQLHFYRRLERFLDWSLLSGIARMMLPSSFFWEDSHEAVLKPLGRSGTLPLVRPVVLDRLSHSLRGSREAIADPRRRIVAAALVAAEGQHRAGGRRKPVLTIGLHPGHRQHELIRRLHGHRLRDLEHAVRHAHRQGGRGLRGRARARRVVGGVGRRQDVHVHTAPGPEVVRRRSR